MYAQVAISRENKKWTIKEHALIDFTPDQIDKHRTAQKMLETVVNSWEFRQELLALVFSSTRGLTNAQIYNLIINGAEILSPEIDFEADITVNGYNKRTSVVGYTYDHTETTWINFRFFNQFNYSDIAGNLFHEWLHKLGFDHRSAREHSSVPYACGYLVRRLVKHLMDGGTLHDVNNADKEIDVILGATVPSKPIEDVLICTRSWRNFFRKKCYYPTKVKHIAFDYSTGMSLE